MTKHLDKVRHDYIRYANCWEDADVLIDGLDIKPGAKVLSIASAGDNSFSLLTQDPEIVVAVDINPIQLRLVELKMAAIKTLEREEYLAFIGFEKSNLRLKLYERVSKEMSEPLLDFWSTRLKEIEEGLVHQGKFEKYFQRFHKQVLPLIHTKSRVIKLFEPKSSDEQANFFKTKWNTWRWRLLFKVFFSKFIMGRLGRDPDFLKEVDIDVSQYILSTAQNHLSSKTSQKNYFLHYIMTGSFGDYLPHYVRKENYDIVRNRLSRMTVFEGLAENAFEKYKSFDRFNLSNIFEYMNADIFNSVVKNLVENGNVDARYAYWNLMVGRVMSTVNEDLKTLNDTSNKLSKRDFGFFYSNFWIDVKNG